EGPVLVVVIKSGRRRIVCGINVTPSLVGEFGDKHAEPISSICLPDSRFLGNIGKSPVAVVAIEHVYSTRQAGRTAGDGQAFVKAGSCFGERGTLPIQIDVASDTQSA